jgi:hypothetical protein
VKHVNRLRVPNWTPPRTPDKLGWALAPCGAITEPTRPARLRGFFVLVDVAATLI